LIFPVWVTAHGGDGTQWGKGNLGMEKVLGRVGYIWRVGRGYWKESEIVSIRAL